MKKEITFSAYEGLITVLNPNYEDFVRKIHKDYTDAQVEEHIRKKRIFWCEDYANELKGR